MSGNIQPITTKRLFYPQAGVGTGNKKPSVILPKKFDQLSWVKEFRKAVKASTQKGWLVIQGRKNQQESNSKGWKKNCRHNNPTHMERIRLA